MADPQTRKLARQIVDIDRRLKGVERTPQLAHSSIDDGFLPVYDKDGNLTAKFGRQDDGTWGAPPLSGPVPSMPVGVTALGGPGMLSVSWTGEYESKAAPLDFDTLEILVDGVLAGAIPNRDGGTVSISAEEGTRYISARIRTLVPRHSSTTSPFGVEVGPPADQLFVEARERIEDAEVSLGETQVRLEGAEQSVTEVRDGLDTLETVTLPSAVADLEAADQAAQEALGGLEERLGDFATDESLGPIREALEDAQEAVATAQQVATEANTAANAASQAALEAAGIAASKGRVIVSETEPTGEDRKSSNIWIKPVPDDPDTEVEEKAVTYVYLEASDEWQPTTSSELAQAAQNALDAREAAQQAQQRADTAIANAEKAQGAAEAAQRTADQATTDAREAHNEAVAAQERVEAKIASGDSLVINGGFENGDLGWPTNGDHGGRSRIIESEDAHSGSHVLELAPDTANVYPESDHIAVEPGRVLHIRGWFKHLGGDGTRVGLLYRTHDKDKAYVGIGYAETRDPQTEVVGEWFMLSGDYEVPEGVQSMRFAFHASGASTSVYHADALQVLDVTEARAAQARADEAYDEAASKLDESQVDAKITASANGKNSITRSTSAASGKGVVVGDLWVQVDSAGDAFRQWYWDGSAWKPAQIKSDMLESLDVHKLQVTGEAKMDSAVIDKLFAETFAAHKITASELTIASIDKDGNLAEGSAGATVIKDGAITTPKLTVTEDMSAAIVNAMSVSTKKLIVTEETILNHATLIGKTVVDDINVQGKLIGTDGVFTGTVDFANVNVTGTQIVNKLGAHSISADKISGGSFSGETFSGGVFKGAEFQSPADPRWNGGIAIDPKNGLRGWGGHDNLTFQLSPVDGSVSISANLRALNSSNQGVVLVPQTGTHGNAALIFTDDGGLGAETAAVWRATYSGAREPLNLRGAHGGGVRIHGNLLIGGNIDGADYISAKGLVSPQLYYYGSGGVTITGQDSTIYARNDSSGPQFAASAIPGRSAGGGANVYCTGFGTLARTSSSRRYKKEIEDWEPSVEKVLALQPRSWVPVNNEDDGSDATAHGRYVGFVAEEVQAVGLEDLVTYSLDENNDRQAEGLHYDRFAAAQQVVLVDHESRIKELEARIAELEGAGR